MAKITHSPIKELVVHEIMEVNMDDLIRERVTPAGSIPLYWCDGMLFSFNSLPLAEGTMDEYLKGIIHWAEVHYAEMKSYVPVAELHDEHYQGTVKIRVIDTSSSPLHKEFIKWLKKNGTSAPQQQDKSYR
jgi:hypothetical protein